VSRASPDAPRCSTHRRLGGGDRWRGCRRPRAAPRRGAAGACARRASRVAARRGRTRHPDAFLLSQHKQSRAASFRPCAGSTPPSGGEADASGRERRYTELSSASLLRAAAARPSPARFQPETASDADAAGAGGDAAEVERVGVLLLNLGGPESLEDVQPFLYNLFADPDIIRLPSAVSFMQKPLAGLISTLRAPKVRAKSTPARSRGVPGRAWAAALRRRAARLPHVGANPRAQITRGVRRVRARCCAVQRATPAAAAGWGTAPAGSARSLRAPRRCRAPSLRARVACQFLVV
jgi:hypothetical protein